MSMCYQTQETPLNQEETEIALVILLDTTEYNWLEEASKISQSNPQFSIGV